MTSPDGSTASTPEHVVAGHAVLHRPHAAGVGGDVAAQAGAVLAREHRVDEARGRAARRRAGRAARRARPRRRGCPRRSRGSWFIRSNDTTMPPATGMHAPDMPVPAPRAVTGTPRLVGQRGGPSATSSAVDGAHHRRRAAAAWRSAPRRGRSRRSTASPVRTLALPTRGANRSAISASSVTSVAMLRPPTSGRGVPRLVEA